MSQRKLAKNFRGSGAVVPIPGTIWCHYVDVTADAYSLLQLYNVTFSWSVFHWVLRRVQPPK